MPTTSDRLVRALALGLGASTAILVSAVPASAAPAPVSGLAASLAPHGLQLTWTASGSGTPIVRDVTAASDPNDPAGAALTPSPSASCAAATCLVDPAFTNTGAPRTYAVWATDDGTAATASADPARLTVDPLPAVPTALSLSASPASLVYGTRTTLTGALTRAGLPLPGATVTVLSGVLGTTPTVLTRVTTGLDGRVALTQVPSRSRTYQLRYDGDAFSAPSTSASTTVRIAPKVVVGLSPSTAQWLTASTLSVSVAPALPGKTVYVQRWTGTAWTGLTSRVLGSTSRASVVLKPAVGRHTYRVVLPAATDRSVGVSRSVTLTVVPRTLVQGVSGPDVLAVERRLAALHYDVGRVDGLFDYSTRHGVTAFQKVEGLARTGRWAATERARVKAPHGFRMRYRDGRLTAEVDITRQVLVLGRNGVIQRIVDVSTGSEQVYYQDGVRNVAHTPRGVFTVFHKINGIRISKLGELYKPSYFFRGYAVHGSGSVPTYPASHGCVRVTNPVADRLFPVLVIGTRVAVYDE